MRHIIPISGKDSLAVALYMNQAQPDLPYKYVFNPTGSELPEVFEWIDRVEIYLGKPINRIGKNLIEIIEDYGMFLPSQQARYCTKEAKIQPFEKWIGKTPATVYYGIRADEKRIGYNNNRYENITPAYPLIAAGITLEGVYTMVTESGLKPPVFFWPKMYDMVCQILGGDKLIKAFLSEWQFDMLFSWRSRANCFHCFNQRLYEWLGLLEFHPDLFEKAASMENKESDYNWMGGGRSLSWIKDNADRIIKKRAIVIARAIKSIQYQSGEKLFGYFVTAEAFNPIFSLTSCGLFCGK